MLPGHHRLDNGPLHRPSIRVRWLRTEVAEAKPPGELVAGIVSLAAPPTRWVGAGGIAQTRDQPTAAGNWWRTQGGMTELPPDTDSHASA